MPIEFRDHITRAMLRAEPDKLFVFGDNLRRRGFGGQAKEMRGETNAIGLPTKRQPDMRPDAFFQDTDLELFRVIETVWPDVVRLIHHVAAGRTVVWPRAGIGSGLAQLAKRAPRIHGFYNTVLERLQSEAGDFGAVVKEFFRP